MSAEIWTYIFIGLTFSMYLGIGIWSRVKESSGFYVAGRGVPAIANGAATAADWMSAASFIGMGGPDQRERRRRFGLSDGLDRGIRVAGIVAGSLPAQIRQVYSARICGRPIWFQHGADCRCVLRHCR